MNKNKFSIIEVKIFFAAGLILVLMMFGFLLTESWAKPTISAGDGSGGVK